MENQGVLKLRLKVHCKSKSRYYFEKRITSGILNTTLEKQINLNL